MDISPSAIDIARCRVPEAGFRVASLFEMEILQGYGSYRLPLAHAAIVAYKPSPEANL